MEGKIIKQAELLGIIEYDIDKRISFTVLNVYEFSVGDVVSFDIGSKRIHNSITELEVAIDLKLLRKKKNLSEKVFRISKVARTFNCSISSIVEILRNNGFDVESSPNTKIYEEQVLILENHFVQLENDLKKKDEQLTIERGTVITSSVVDIIYPSLIVLEFFGGKKALLPLNNLSWNKSRSEKILQATKKGDELQVVVLEVDTLNPVVSKKHLIPRPSETELWNEIELGIAINGRVYEVLINKAVIELENGFFGLIDLSAETKFDNDQEFSFNIDSKNDYSLYLGLTLNPEVKVPIQDVVLEPVEELKIDLVKEELDSKRVTSQFAAIENELQSIEKFQESIYFNFCDDDQEEFITQSFELNSCLFACSISVDYSLCIQFGMNLPSWESDFKNKLIPYLTNGENPISEQDALDALAQEKYWVRINRYVKNEVEKIGWVLFNEEFFLSGFVDEDNSNFIVLSLSIQRTHKNKSNQKTRSLSEGTFLYDSKITFISPLQNKSQDSDQKEIFQLLDDKTKAFGIISKLKEESGALLLEEGLSLQIFDRFLEFQENLLKKGNVSNRVWIDEKFRRISSDLGQLSIQLQIDLSDLCIDDSVSTLVTIRTLQSSTKKSRDEEFVFFSDALLEISPSGSKLHFNSDDISLEDLEKGFYIEPKVSLKQFQVQREVLQDFFSKKIKLEHIESLLLKPEKIQPPKLVPTKFFNKMLTETELSNPNNNQVNSVKKSIGNKNIFLVQGPPGTGKTTVIAEIVQQLSKNNEKILVTSQTHVAVDNVLEKVSEVKDLSLLRLGNIQRVKTDLRKYHKEKQIETYSNYFTD
ncbi:AAA domain-containing protein, partial [Crocinitomicaceae bacterium]|nr:AAA domain-containing protein [Crocinitomicaceae bacterium]